MHADPELPDDAVSTNRYETTGTDSNSNPNYFPLSGTSMAAPVGPSGAAALRAEVAFPERPTR